MIIVYVFVVQTFPKCDIMLDNDMQGSGVYLPELDEPEYCNPQNTCLWELHALKVGTASLHMLFCVYTKTSITN